MIVEGDAQNTADKDLRGDPRERNGEYGGIVPASNNTGHAATYLTEGDSCATGFITIRPGVAHAGPTGLSCGFTVV